MQAGLFEHRVGTIAQAGWADVVDSLQGAIEDRSHVVVLGVVLAVLVVIWANWRIAKWLLSQSNKPSS